jgi:uncharacterized protein YndB with AHSA1/START domain
MTNQTALEPVRKQLAVACDVETAFQTFTEDIAKWWPTQTHSITDNPETVVFESAAGGRVYERTPTGKECDWARILVYEPPHRVVLEWLVNPAVPPTEVEVRFMPDGEGTRVELEHRGWERDADTGEARRAEYNSGWPGILEKYRAAAG